MGRGGEGEAERGEEIIGWSRHVETSGSPALRIIDIGVEYRTRAVGRGGGMRASVITDCGGGEIGLTILQYFYFRFIVGRSMDPLAGRSATRWYL